MRIKLTPPKLNVLSKVAANRPMRRDRFNISKANYGDKVVVNCLGHGGAGYTTLFGSVEEALRLLPFTKEPVRVLGAGCMGLLSAIELKRRGYTVAGITTKELYDIASWAAGGYFAFVSVKTSERDQEKMHEMAMHTFLTYQEIERGKHPYLGREVACLIPVYCSEDTETGLEDLEAKRLIPAAEKVTIDFGNVQYKNFKKYVTYYMNVTQIMRQLSDEVRRLQIPIEIREVGSFDEVEERVVFNCTGLGGKVLNKDQTLVPVRGHILNLAPSNSQGHMDYMIYTKDPHFEGKYIYMFPKTVSVTSTGSEPCEGLLGGTFIELPDGIREEEVKRIDTEQYQDLYERSALFFQNI